MANYGTYSTLSNLRAELRKQAADTADDTALLTALESASRQADRWCNRHFQPRSETRYFRAIDADELLVDDLLSVTTLQTDDDGDRTYENTWAATDYDLEPENDFPKWRLAVTPDGDYTFPEAVRRGVKVAGVWGFGDGETATSYIPSTTTLAEDLDTSETGVDVASGTVFSAGNTILIDSEQMYISGVSTNTLTVVRGVNGTTAATHSNGATIYLYRYPADVVEATTRLAARNFRLRDAPFGVAGGGDMGTQDVIPGNDPSIWAKLGAYRRLAVG